MTTRLYYTDPYCRRFEATVTAAFEHAGRPAVVLDRTAFYPTSGGQPFDTGRLGNVQVVDTVDADVDVVHVLSAPLPAGTMVQGEIDWSRRFDHMQQHTGQHLLSAAFDRLLDNRTTSFHMGADLATIDLAREASWDEIRNVEREANRVVWEDRSVSIRFVSSEEAAALPLRKEPSREGTLRLVEVADFDLSACGGAHVARTGAIGAILVVAAEKVKRGTRITFACGGRALAAFDDHRDAVAGSVRALSVLPRDLPDAIERLRSEAKELRKAGRAFQEALAGHEAARLLAAASEVNGYRVIVARLDGWDAQGIKAVASASAASAPAAVALFSAAAPYAVVVARSAHVPVDAGAILRTLTERFGGRGGGKGDMAQGGGLLGDIGDLTKAARDLITDP